MANDEPASKIIDLGEAVLEELGVSTQTPALDFHSSVPGEVEGVGIVEVKLVQLLVQIYEMLLQPHLFSFQWAIQTIWLFCQAFSD